MSKAAAILGLLALGLTACDRNRSAQIWDEQRVRELHLAERDYSTEQQLPERLNEYWRTGYGFNNPNADPARRGPPKDF